MELLKKENYYKTFQLLNQVNFNNYFARFVAEQKINGWIYADSNENPQTFYILHPYGMSLLLGNCNNTKFNMEFKEYVLNTRKNRKSDEWMQVFPFQWNLKLEELFGNYIVKSSENIENKTNCIELNTRVNFKFNVEKFLELKKNYQENLYETKRTTKEIVENMKGAVIPKNFWKTADEFVNYGVGFSLIYEQEVVSTAYSAFIFSNLLELGIETNETVRGKGFARHICTALLDYCLANNYEPIWACRLENMGSYLLAQKLGFEPTLYLPYYKLSV